MHSNIEISDVLKRIGQLYEMEGDSWRARTYLEAAQQVRGCAPLDGFDATKLSGIGKGTGVVIEEIKATGTCNRLKALEQKLPAFVLDLTVINGIGAKTALKLYKAHGIKNLKDLEAAIVDGPLKDATMAPKYMEALAFHKEQQEVLAPRNQLVGLVKKFKQELGKVPGVRRIEVAGSYRRHKDTCKDIDILVAATSNRDEIFAAFKRFGTEINSGDTKCSIRVHEPVPIQVDLRIVSPSSWGAALCYFTGPKEHNIEVRALAKARGLLANEYGIFRGKKKLGGKNERDLYNILNIPYVNPKHRESNNHE